MDEKSIEKLQEAAVEMHYLEPNGNCAQCVACVLSELAGVTPDEAFRAMEGFGGGMGSMTQVCGAVSGGVYAIGCAKSSGIDARTTKAATYATVADFVAKFKETYGSTQCCDLRNPDASIAKGICDGYIRHAVKLATQALGA